MMVLLIVFIAVLLVAIVYLTFLNQQKEKTFRKKIYTLEQIIVQLSQKQITLNNQIQLSDAMARNIKENNATLSQDVFQLNYELFEIITRNNLLK